ncbi:MAG: hypothetical protein M3Y57_08300, partial [Acidobacteriota bacterium]|nr:hypothetical protein [Acidobacteriota bacterium]
SSSFSLGMRKNFLQLRPCVAALRLEFSFPRLLRGPEDWPGRVFLFLSLISLLAFSVGGGERVNGGFGWEVIEGRGNRSFGIFVTASTC